MIDHRLPSAVTAQLTHSLAHTYFPSLSFLFFSSSSSQYFCAGGVKKHLGTLGFPHVYNKNEDFYKMITSKRTPE
jgi:hypothetical protein